MAQSHTGWNHADWLEGEVSPSNSACSHSEGLLNNFSHFTDQKSFDYGDSRWALQMLTGAEYEALVPPDVGALSEYNTCISLIFLKDHGTTAYAT